jgi:hypothetical protein
MSTVREPAVAPAAVAKYSMITATDEKGTMFFSTEMFISVVPAVTAHPSEPQPFEVSALTTRHDRVRHTV